MSEELQKTVEAQAKDISAMKAAILDMSQMLGGMIMTLGLMIRKENDGSISGGLNVGDPVPKQGILTKCWLMVQDHEKKLNDQKIILADKIDLGLNRRN